MIPPPSDRPGDKVADRPGKAVTMPERPFGLTSPALHGDQRGSIVVVTTVHDGDGDVDVHGLHPLRAQQRHPAR